MMPISLSLVPTSGAGTSVSGPMMERISYAYLLVSLSSSARDIFFGLQATPPLAPPYGKPTTWHFSVMSKARAVIKSKSTSGAYLIPPFVGSYTLLCWTL